MQAPHDDVWTRHRGPVTSVAPIPGSRRVVTTAYDGAVGLYDLETGATELLGHHGHLTNEVVVDAAGRLAATASSDYTIGLWDLTTRRLVRRLRGHADDVDTFLFLEGGRGASGSHDQRILLWDLATGAVLMTFDGHEGRVTSLACQGDTLLSTGHDHTLRAWSLETGALLRTLGPFDLRTDTCSLDLARDRLALGCDDGWVRLFAIRTGVLLHAFEAHRSGIKKVAFDPRTGALLTAAYDQRAVVWDPETWRPRVELEPHAARWERSFCWGEASILAGTFDGTVLEWETRTGRRLREVGETAPRRGNPCFNRIAAEPDGRVALVSDDGLLRRATLGAESRWAEGRLPARGAVLANAVALSTRHGIAAVGTHDQRVLIFDLDRATAPERVIDLREGPINAIAVQDLGGADFSLFVACYEGCVARVASNGEVLARHRLHHSAVKAVRLHPTQPLGLSCDAERVMLVWDLDGHVKHELIGHTALINDADLDPTGAFVASVARDFTLKLWALDTGRLLRSVPIGKRSLKSVCYATDDTVLVGDYWGHLHAVDLPSGKVISCRLARNGVSSLARCGDLVAACSYDGSVHLVEPATLETRAQLVAMRQRVDTAGAVVP